MAETSGPRVDIQTRFTGIILEDRLHAGCSASHEMHYEKDDAHNQGNVDERGGNVKCKKSQQPKHNQNCGNYPKHVSAPCFRFRELFRFRTLEMRSASWWVEEIHADATLIAGKTYNCPFVNTSAFLIHIGLNRAKAWRGGKRWIGAELGASLVTRMPFFRSDPTWRRTSVWPTRLSREYYG